jgi:signal transduction histidine kinase
VRLTLAVRRIIRNGRTDARVPLDGSGDAIDELTGLFNTMLDKIEGLVTAMRGALDNVSHDLRTPLTRLRGTAEMALASAPDVDRYREALADCVEESDRVLVMLNTLMDISEAESGDGLQREPVGSPRSWRGRWTCIVTSRTRGVTLAADAPRRDRRGRSHATGTGGREPDRQRREVRRPQAR